MFDPMSGSLKLGYFSKCRRIVWTVHEEPEVYETGRSFQQNGLDDNAQILVESKEKRPFPLL